MKCIELFENTPYLDNLLDVYPLKSAIPIHLESKLKIVLAHQGRRTKELIGILQGEVKFPCDVLCFTKN